MADSEAPVSPQCGLSVVVVSYESGDALAANLPRLRAVCPDCELIVVDNASQVHPPDPSLASEQGARLLRNLTNEGFGRACNRGAREAGSRYVLFANPDVELLSLPETIDDLRTTAGVFGLVAPGSAAPTRPTHGVFREPRPLTDAVGLLVAPYWPRHWPRPPWAHRQGDDWASGAAMLVDREEFLEVGGFDNDFFFLYEDRELSWRYRKRGLPVREGEGFACRHASGGSVDGAAHELEVRRRYLAVLGLIQYWHVTRGATAALRWGRMLLVAHCLVAAIVRALAHVMPTRRLAKKAVMERRVLESLRSATPVQGALRVACEVARGVRGSEANRA